MDLNEYQEHALTTASKNGDDFARLMSVVLGIGDESGEVQSLFKKWIRDEGADPDKLPREAAKKELGDVLWYIAVIARELNIDLEDVARANVEKLKSRKKRDALGGSGDNR